jgi:hypothetical protein
MDGRRYYVIATQGHGLPLRLLLHLQLMAAEEEHLLGRRARAGRSAQLCTLRAYRLYITFCFAIANENGRIFRSLQLVASLEQIPSRSPFQYFFTK